MDQLSIINSYSDQWMKVLEKDPVRPNITFWERIASNRECFAVHESIIIKSVLCAAYIGRVPENESEVLGDWTSFNVACFYSVWSFQPGYGRKIIRSAMNHIKWNRPYVTQAVTYSPKTEMARRFHLNNGAKLIRENEDSYNFEYNL